MPPSGLDCAEICPEHNDAFDACMLDPDHIGYHVSPDACRWTTRETI